MKKVSLLLLGILVVSLSSCLDDDADFVIPPVDGPWVLTDYITANPYDFNNDGVASRNFIDETFCLDFETLEFNSAGNGFNISRSFPDIQLYLVTDTSGAVVGTEYETICFQETAVSEFLWRQNGNQVIMETKDIGQLLWETNGNELFITLREWLPIEIYNGFEVISIYEDVQLVYRRL